MDIVVFAIIVYQVRNTKCTQTEYHHFIVITLDKELQVHKTQPMYLMSSPFKNHNNHIEDNSSFCHCLWCHTEYSQFS